MSDHTSDHVEALENIFYMLAHHVSCCYGPRKGEPKGRGLETQRRVVGNEPRLVDAQASGVGVGAGRQRGGTAPG